MKQTHNSKNSYTQLKKTDRNEIKAMLEKGYTQTDIATALGRNKSSISREVRRNSVKGEYLPDKAQHKARVRRKSASFRGKKIITSDGALRRYIEERLNCGWSPELISGRLKQVRTDLLYVSKNTIYRYLDSDYGNRLTYNKRTTRKSAKRGNVAGLDDRIFIDDRPDIAERRARIGDWELDFVESGKSSTAVLVVLVDRLSRYILAQLLPNKRIDTVHRAVARLVADMPVHTVTCDNDICLQKHGELSELIKAAIFFCHPYCSWEKGSVEHVNGLLRNDFPKGCDLGKFSQAQVDEVVNRLNGRPKKCLEFLTPNEVMSAHNTHDLKTSKSRDMMLSKVLKQTKNTHVGCCT